MGIFPLIKTQQHEKYLHKTLAITSEAATMEHISESYKRATGRPIPAVPALVGKALVKFNAALQNVYVSTGTPNLMCYSRPTDIFQLAWKRSNEPIKLERLEVQMNWSPRSSWLDRSANCRHTTNGNPRKKMEPWIRIGTRSP